MRFHDLQRLLDDAVAYEPTLVAYYGLCEGLTAFYFLDRYPFIAEPPGGDVVLKALGDAREFVDELLARPPP